MGGTAYIPFVGVRLPASQKLGITIPDSSFFCLGGRTPSKLGTAKHHLDCRLTARHRGRRGNVGMEAIRRWTGRCYRRGTNKWASDAATYAIFRALKIFDQRQENARRCAIFADSTAATIRVRTDAVGPGQQWARAAIEVCARIISRGNEVLPLWAHAHSGIAAMRRLLVADPTRFKSRSGGRSASPASPGGQLRAGPRTRRNWSPPMPN